DRTAPSDRRTDPYRCARSWAASPPLDRDGTALPCCRACSAPSRAAAGHRAHPVSPARAGTGVSADVTRKNPCDLVRVRSPARIVFYQIAPPRQRKLAMHVSDPLRGSIDLIRRHARLFETDRQAVIATTLHGEIVYWSRAAERLYGWSREEVQ